MSAVLIMLTIVCMFDQLVVGTVFSGEGGHGTAAALGSKDDVMVKTFIPLFQALLATKCPRAHPATETDQDKVREELGCCDVKCRSKVPKERAVPKEHEVSKRRSHWNNAGSTFGWLGGVVF